MEVIKMRHKKSGEIVDIYYINSEGIATYFSREGYKKNGSGWNKLGITKFLPIDVPNADDLSKTKRNKIKSRLKLVSAIWECTDGLLYPHENLEDAIEHERILFEQETNKNE